MRDGGQFGSEAPIEFGAEALDGVPVGVELRSEAADGVSVRAVTAGGSGGRLLGSVLAPAG